MQSTTFRRLKGVEERIRRRLAATSVYRRGVRRAALSLMVRHTDNFADVTWLGRPVWQNPLDAWLLQETIIEEQVDFVVECGTNRGGSSYFMATIFDLLERGRVLTIDVVDLVEDHHPRVEYHVASSTDPETVDLARRRIAESGAVRPLVLLDSDHAKNHVSAELAAYADLVPVGGLMLVQDGAIDELSMMWEARPGPLPAIREFLAADDRFVLDAARSTRFLFGHSPDGWLRRVR
jgi:cephalosporin hydroxylase